MKRYRVTINGRAYDVEIENPRTSPVQVTVNGEPYAVQLEDVRDEPEAGAKPARPVVVGVPSTPSAGPVASSERRLVAPMPGTILSVQVSAGDAVTRGQELCVLEAMKMRNSIKSPRDGVISSVAVHEGQTVAHGTLLVEFK